MQTHTVVVPAPDRPDTPRLLQLAAALAGAEGRLVVLAVVPPPAGDDPGGVLLGRVRAARRRLRLAIAALTGVRAEVTPRVRVAVRPDEAIRHTVHEEQASLLVLDAAALQESSSWGEAMDALVASPPCDAALVRAGEKAEVGSVLLPARGGPTAELALRLASTVAAHHEAPLTVLHVETPGGTARAREREQGLFAALIGDTPQAQVLRLTTDDPLGAIQLAARGQDVVVLGAHVAAQGVGAIPTSLLATHPGVVLIARPAAPVDPSIFAPLPAPPPVVVGAWFAENSFHCREFTDLDDLLLRKRRQDARIGLLITGADTPETLPGFARALADIQSSAPLVDAVTVLGNPSVRPHAAELGWGFLETQGATHGTALAGALRALGVDLAVCLGADLRNSHAKHIYGLLGPLLREARVSLVAGHYRLPDVVAVDDPAAVTAFAVRPLLNLLFPELVGVVDPLTTEYALRPAAFEPEASLDSGALGLLLHAYQQHGLGGVAQVDLDDRAGAPAPLERLTALAFAAAGVILRAGLRSRPGTAARLHETLHVLRDENGHLALHVLAP